MPIIDRPEFIKRVQDRISMLRFVSELKLSSNREFNSDLQLQNQHICTFGVPKQIAVYNAAELADATTFSGMSFPLIAKPIAADGSSGSHKMALVFNQDGLLKQSPPLVLQEFVNHGGVVFKVYVAGDYVRCVERKSIPNLSDETMAALVQVGSVSFSQISNMTMTQDSKDKMHLEEIEMPPECFVMEIARGLRSSIGLNLFNFDMIRDERVGNHYLVIDINYFPGYEKLSGYETVLTDFMCSMVHKEQKDDSDLALRNDSDENSMHSCGNQCDYEEEVERGG